MLSAPLRTLLLFAALLLSFVAALGQKPLVAFERGRGSIPLKDAKIQLSGNEWPGVIRAANGLSKDFGRVTGDELDVVVADSTADFEKSGMAIIVGTIGHSEIIDKLIGDRKINVNKIKGQWEAYQTAVLRNPIPGVSQALVIVGSDKRGSIFGIYEISEQIGVSPWYFWADTAVKKHKAIYALPTSHTQKSPSVKYRGIFLNDEQPALTSWVENNFPDGKYGPGFHKEFYSLVFELLLRLKANFLWPTMWNSMFAVDDPENPKNADYYGIVMSTSHTEPLQMSTEEWNKLGNGTWDYTSNEEAIRKYWEKGVQRVKDYEGVWTVGMRGNGDRVLSDTLVTELLERIVHDQRDILKKGLGVSDVSQVPQVWCLYKDIQAYYEAGMRVPEDVILLWTDDNWGNIRRLPGANETNPAGMYYHFDYVGSPRSYKWINTVSLQKTWDQLRLTYEHNARDIWVVNVGDLKPLEIPIDYYMNLAYDYDTWGKENTVFKWELAWARREFGDEHAKEIAEILDLYGFYAARRKYELVDQDTYSVLNYNEADIVLGEWADLFKRAEAVYDDLPKDYKPSFFEMVLHPVKAGYILHDIYISAAKNKVYGHQRRNMANSIAEHVREQFKADHELSEEYHSILDGKWEGMMTQPHLGSNYWQQPMRNSLPPLVYTMEWETALSGVMGVGVENTNGSVPGDDRFNTRDYSNNTLLLNLDRYAPVQHKWIEIFSRGTKKFDYKVSPHNPWVKVSPATGTVRPDDETPARVKVSVDWSRAPKDGSIAFIDITSSEDYGNFGMPTVHLQLNNTLVPKNFHGFVESDKTISIEAEHASKMTRNGKVHYKVVERLGRTKSAVSLEPVTADTQNTETGPRLEYDLYTFTNPAYGANITVYFAAGLNVIPDHQLAYAISLGDEEPQTVKYVPTVELSAGEDMPPGWDKAVADGNTWLSTTTHKTKEAGSTKLKVWALEPNVVIQKIVVDLGGVKRSYLGPPESARV